jgi:hypothetical protein
MIFGWPGLALQVAFGSCYALLIRAAGSLVAAAFGSYYGDVMGLPLLLFCVALSAFPSTLDGGHVWCGSATLNGC